VSEKDTGEVIESKGVYILERNLMFLICSIRLL